MTDLGGQKGTDNHHRLHRVGADVVDHYWTKLSGEKWSARVLVRGIFTAAPQRKNATDQDVHGSYFAGQLRPARAYQVGHNTMQHIVVVVNLFLVPKTGYPEGGRGTPPRSGPRRLLHEIAFELVYGAVNAPGAVFGA